MKKIKPKRARLSDMGVTEVSVCDKAANPYAKICFFKRDYESLLDAASERHKSRIDRGLRQAASRRQFDKRLAKSRAKFDGDVAAIMQGLADPTEDAGQNPPPLTAEPGLMEREPAAAVAERSGRPAHVEPTPDSAIAGRGMAGHRRRRAPWRNRWAGCRRGPARRFRKKIPRSRSRST